MGKFLDDIRHAWSATNFSRSELRDYAESNLVGEVRTGVRAMSAVLAGLVLVATLAHAQLQLDGYYLHAYALVGALCIHIFLSASQIKEVRGLFLLGMALLVISATALVFVAHRTGHISPLLLANVLLLFVVIPMVPWGLREATIVTVVIWLLLTSSTMGVAARFGADSLMLLQVFMFTTAVASLAVVGRAVAVRKNELTARHDLEETRERLFRLSNVDPLTGAWNRRYLKHALADLCERFGDGNEDFHFALFDIDDFKIVNDTYGHAAGDKVLRCVSTALSEHVGEQGYVIRLGGDEFCVLLVARDPEPLLRAALHDIRRRVRKINGLEQAKISLSYGHVATSLDSTIPMAALYRRADQNMYAAKESRNGRGHAVPGENINFQESGSWLLVGS
ncbi:MAG: GGDEF domain-containing protein [Gammaproteobacteria bacterium]|nr:GGDEF domain-containing protein [Gammaproteobacteria bacterium]